jgi:signal transduction histidine kinase/CheY-like chemotaxis protein
LSCPQPLKGTAGAGDLIVMSASALAAIWIAALLPGTAVIVLVLVKRAAASHELEGAVPAAEAALPPVSDAQAQSGNGSNLSHELLLLRMSHDLRSPLGSLVTLCQLLVEGDAGPLSMKQRQYVEVIRRSGQSVLGLVDDILDLAAVESGRSDVDVQTVDLAAMVRQVAENHEAMGREKEIPVQVSLRRESLPASADEKRLRHLLERMVEYLLSVTEQGYVELAVDDGDGKAVVRVRNTHDGLSESARHTLALAYQDGGHDADDSDEGQAPLPIAIAARLARRIGLPIEVRTGGEEGLSLELSVPLAEAGARVSPDAARPRHAAGARILLVDDDAAERSHVASRLEEGGYAVTVAASGSEGLALLRDGHFEAVVLDLVMPGMSGLEVLRAARSDERLAMLPFVVLSALYITRGERSVLGPAVASIVRKGDGTADELLRALDRALAPAAQPHAIGDGRHA